MAKDLYDRIDTWLAELDDSVDQWEELHNEILPELKKTLENEKRLRETYEPRCKCVTCGLLENVCADHAPWVEECISYVEKVEYLQRQNSSLFKNNLRLVKEILTLRGFK